MVSLSISSQAFSKDRTSTFVYIFSSQTSITCFGIPPWSHGIWFTTDWKITIDHKTSRLNFHFLRKLARESESRVQRGMVKNLHPSGVSPFLWLTDPSPPSSSWPLLAEFKNSSLAFPSRASRSGLAGLPLIASAMVAAELPHDVRLYWAVFVCSGWN